MALYRIILNALPILLPANLPLRKNLQNLFARLFTTEDENDNPFVDESPSSSSESSPQSLPYPLHISPGDRREARLSSSAQVHQSWVRKKTRRWHSVLAGAVAGAVAVSFEKRSRQTVIAQQLFVRYVLQAPYQFKWLTLCLLFGSGLQGSYNAYSEKRGFRIPHGEVLVFALAYELTLLSLCSFLMSEKMRSDCVCVPFKPTYPPRVLQTLVCLEHHHVYLDAHIAIG